MTEHRTPLTQDLSRIARQYPGDLVALQMGDVQRIAFHTELACNVAARRRNGPGDFGRMSICDLGGGIGMFPLACAARGFGRVVLVDDFRDTVNLQIGQSIFALHRKYNVEVVSRDLIAEGIADAFDGRFDVITSFDCIEHCHHSPRKLFRQVLDKLRPGGTFILGVPNCVNLRKRLTVPLGIGKWSQMSDWYESEVFRGHVREPDVGDLRYIARDMGLAEVRIIGRNWLGYSASSRVVRRLTPLIDGPMRLFPSLCSNLYLVGNKPG